MGRAPCCDKDGLKKGPWLPEEDQKLIVYIQKHGPGNWRTLPKKAGLQRCGKSCRLRWTNYLHPDIKRGRFSFEEEETIIQFHSILGNKWSTIAAKLPGRTDNEIKNYWNTHIRKRMLRMGIDPVTHTRRLDLLDLPSLLNAQQQNHPQLNILKLLGLQTLVNPELLKLATLLSTNQNLDANANLNFLLQNQVGNNTIQNPLQNTTNTHIQTSIQNSFTTEPSVPVIGDDQVMQPDLMQYPTHVLGFEAQNLGPQLILSNGYGNFELNQCHFLSSSDQAIINSLLDDSGAHSDNSNQSLSLSSSQQTPLSSNSMYPNSSSNSEDEIDSYCRNLLNFDIPVDLFDV